MTENACHQIGCEDLCCRFPVMERMRYGEFVRYSADAVYVTRLKDWESFVTARYAVWQAAKTHDTNLQEQIMADAGMRMGHIYYYIDMGDEENCCREPSATDKVYLAVTGACHRLDQGCIDYEHRPGSCINFQFGARECRTRRESYTPIHFS